jgi:translation initiation factor IF-3
VVESNPKQDGRNMVMVIAPHRNAQLLAQQAQHAAQAERRQAKADQATADSQPAAAEEPAQEQVQEQAPSA